MISASPNFDPSPRTYTALDATAKPFSTSHLLGKADDWGLDGADAAPHRRRFNLGQLRGGRTVVRGQVLHQKLNMHTTRAKKMGQVQTRG